MHAIYSLYIHVVFRELYIVPLLKEIDGPVVIRIPWNEQPTDSHQLSLLVEELLQLLLTGSEDTDNKTKLVREGVTHG